MTVPAISVILPVFNGEKFLAAALDSVLAQSYTDWELIAVDDGSTDGTPALLARYAAGPRVTVMTQAQQGVAQARNQAIAMARGHYVAFLDADDAWLPEYLQRQAAALEAHAPAVLSLAGWQYMDEAGRPLPQAIVRQPHEVAQLRADLFWRNSMVPSSVVVRRAALDQAGHFDTAFSACEDWDLWLRLSAVGDFAAVPEVLVWYRTHGENMSDDVDRMERERQRVHRKHLGPASGDDDPAHWTPQRRQAAGYARFISALAYWRARREADARARLGEALALWPGLAREDEFYYELACADQPRGYRGTPVGLRLDHSAARLRRLLAEAWPAGSPVPAAEAWGRAAFALARLAVACQQPVLARRFAWQAVRAAPPALRGQAARVWARAWLPTAWVGAARRARDLWAPRASR